MKQTVTFGAAVLLSVAPVSAQRLIEHDRPAAAPLTVDTNATNDVGPHHRWATSIYWLKRRFRQNQQDFWQPSYAPSDNEPPWSDEDRRQRLLDPWMGGEPELTDWVYPNEDPPPDRAKLEERKFMGKLTSGRSARITFNPEFREYLLAEYRRRKAPRDRAGDSNREMPPAKLSGDGG
jgi:hypothetical protein